MENYLKKELYELIKRDESIFDFLQESSLDGLWYWDLEKPENEWMSERFWRILGYDPAEKKHNSAEWQNIIDPDDRTEALENIRKHLDDPSYPYDQVLRYKHKNGSTVWIHCRGMAVRDKDGKPLRMIGAHHDITRNMQIEHELNSFFSMVPDLICIASLEGAFIRVNRSWEKVLGYSESELIAKSANELIHTDDLDFTRNECRKLLNNTPSVQFVNRYRHKNGNYKFLEWTVVLSPDKKELYAAARSITEKRRLMEELINAKNKAEESERSYRMFIDQSKEGIYLMEYRPPMPLSLDPEEMVDYIYDHSYIVECNKAMVKMYCLSDSSELIGKRMIDFHGYNNIPENKESVRNFVLSGFRIDNEKTLEKDKKGNLHYFLNSATGFIENGFLVRSWGTQIDITEKQIYEIELLKAKVKAEESDRLKTAFLQNMSHEVRTPLNVIVGFSKLMAEKQEASEDMGIYTRMIDASSDKLVRIITDVIEISQLQSGQVKTILSETDVVRLIDKIFLSFTDNAQEKNIEFVLSLRIPGNESIIISDSAKLEKLFTHLVDNAIKFTHKGSVKVCAEIENGFLLFSVSDTGIGISSETQKIIFEPFRQLETELSRNYGGNGLGLALVKAYTDMLNGTISLESEIGRGTTVSVSIPLNNSGLGKKNIPAVKTDHTQLKMSTILVAEDEYSNYMYLHELLNGTTNKVLHARNGKEAIDLCRNNNDISLILMDIKMPVMDGNTAAKLIKSFRPALPIIAQTAYADSDMLCLLNVFDDVIIKPVTRTELKEKMIKYLG